jgi:uncharacterized protein YacL (UPF0231 family)
MSYGPKTDELVNLLEAEHLTIRPNELSLAIFQKMWQNLTTRYDAESDRLKGKNSYIKKELRHGLNTL